MKGFDYKQAMTDHILYFKRDGDDITYLLFTLMTGLLQVVLLKK